MIRIGKPYIREEGDCAILENNIEIDDSHDIVWFKVDRKYKDFLCTERDDAYLIACLNYAMLHGHDIECESPITESLLFKINTYLIPALIENNPHFHNVQISCDVATDTLPCAGFVATGISCGVDSLHALSEHSHSKYPTHNITHLTFNNVGSHGEGAYASELYHKRIVKPKQFAKEYGYEFVWSDSNLMDVVKQNHFKTHTYSSMFPVFCLQKLYSKYFYASGGYKFNEFKLSDAPLLCSGAYEMLSLDVFSTPSLKIYSEGLGLTRLEKLKEVVKYAPSYKYLNVCLEDGDNCSKCEKCVRTLLGLDAVGALDFYHDVFDIEYYKTHKAWYLQQLVYKYMEGKHDYKEMYRFFKHEISLSMRVKGTFYKIKLIVKDIIRSNNTLYFLAKRLLKQ